MNKYIKDNLILGDSLENLFGWITLGAVCFGSIYFFLLALQITAGPLKADAENFHTANVQVSFSWFDPHTIYR